MKKIILLCTAVCVVTASAYSETLAEPNTAAAGARFKSAVSAVKKQNEEKKAFEAGMNAVDEDFPDAGSSSVSRNSSVVSNSSTFDAPSRGNSVASNSGASDVSSTNTPVLDADFGTLYDENTGEEVKGAKYQKTPIVWGEESPSGQHNEHVEKNAPNKSKKKNKSIKKVLYGTTGAEFNKHLETATPDELKEYQQEFERNGAEVLSKKEKRAAKKNAPKPQEGEDLGLSSVFNEEASTPTSPPVAPQAPEQPVAVVEQNQVVEEPEVNVSTSDVHAQISALSAEAQLFAQKLKSIEDAVAAVEEQAATLKAVKAIMVADSASKPSSPVAVRD